MGELLGLAEIVGCKELLAVTWLALSRVISGYSPIEHHSWMDLHG